MSEKPAADGMKQLAGLGRLFTRPRPPVGTTPSDVVYAENKWKLLRYRAAGGGRRWATPVVLIPSLINRHYVLDLLPGKSFAEYMVKRGHDVFIVDWGTPEDEDRFVTFDEVADRYVGRAIRAACRAAHTDKAHVLGYCLGGTLAAIHAALRPEHVASLTALAAPIAFHDSGLLSLWTRTTTFDLQTLVEAMGNVPWQLMQSAFHLLRPTMSLAKTVQLIDKAWDDEFLDGFMAIEAWGNDNVSFPGACYEKYVDQLYRKDALVKGQLSVSGSLVDLGNIEAPTLAITFEHDHIVPWQSAAVLLEKVGATDKKHIHLAGGHVGAVVSKKAAAALWPQISEFWARHETVI